MRISDWSSDVCSSDLKYPVSIVNPGFTLAPILGIIFGIVFLDERLSERVLFGAALTIVGVLIVTLREAKVVEARSTSREIGRESRRERVCKYVSISVVAVSLKKKIKKEQVEEI